MSKRFNIILLISAILGLVGFLFLRNDSVDINGMFDKKTEKVTKKTYESSDYKFLFEYEDGFVITSVPLEAGNKIVFELAKPRNGFQITVFPFDELGPLTEERIKKDLPDLVVVEAKSVSMAGVETLQFKSIDESVGGTFEVWFVYSGNFYQIQTYKEFSLELQEIMKSWQFK